MRKLSILLIAVASLAFVACNNSAKPTEDTHAHDTHADGTEHSHADHTSTLGTATYIVNNAESVVNWEGDKAIGGDKHFGTINIVAGKIETKDDAIVAGKFSIDMTSIDAVDMKDSPEYKAKLEGHLKNEDFFNVTEFPVATLEITDGSDLNAVKANLTIKDKTQEIVFPVSASVTDGVAKFSTAFEIDRTKYGVVFNSGNFFTDLAKDKIINDEIKFKVELVAK